MTTESVHDVIASAQDEVVAVTLPAEVDLVVLARFTAATIAARAGFDVEEIEDLRLAVDELCMSFGPIERNRNVQLEFRRAGDEVTITCVFEPLDDQRATEDGVSNSGAMNWSRAGELSTQLLDALVDRHGSDERNGRPCAWLTKRKSPSHG
jgi:hypothetical protein